MFLWDVKLWAESHQCMDSSVLTLLCLEPPVKRQEFQGNALRVPHLPGCLLHKALVGDTKGAAQSLGRVVLEHLLVHHVHVQVDGGIDGSIHSSMAIKHCKISLFFLVLPGETRGGENSGESNTNGSLDCLKALNLGFVLSSLNCN